MKKLGILFASVFLLGLVFQSCNNGKTYAEMQEEDKESIPSEVICSSTYRTRIS